MSENNTNQETKDSKNLTQKEILDQLRADYDSGKISFMDYSKKVKEVMKGSFK